MGTPLVTIGIPNYNYARYLRECVESALAQDYGNLEVLVSDNCSTDESLEVLSSISDPRLRLWRNERNIGIFPNWDKLLAEAKGTYVKILPSDDLLEPTFVSRCVRAMEETGSDSAFTGLRAFGTDSWEMVPAKFGFAGDCSVGDLQEIIRQVETITVFVAPTPALYRASLVPERYGGDAGSRGVDMGYWAKAITRGRTVFVNEVLASVRYHERQEHRARDMSRSLGDMLDAMKLLKPHDASGAVEAFSRHVSRDFSRSLFASLLRGNWGIAWRIGRQLARHGRLADALVDAFRPAAP